MATTHRRHDSTEADHSAHHKAMMETLMQFRLVLRSMRRHYRSVEERCGVSGAQLWVMAQVATSPGVKVGDLAQALGIHQSTVSNILEKLEESGLVERRRVADDRRVVRIFLTTEGNRIVRRAPRPLRGVLQQALLELPTASLKALNRHLGELTAHLARHRADDANALLPDAVAVVGRSPRRTRERVAA